MEKIKTKRQSCRYEYVVVSHFGLISKINEEDTEDVFRSKKEAIVRYNTLVDKMKKDKPKNIDIPLEIYLKHIGEIKSTVFDFFDETTYEIITFDESSYGRIDKIYFWHEHMGYSADMWKKTHETYRHWTNINRHTETRLWRKKINEQDIVWKELMFEKVTDS